MAARSAEPSGSPPLARRKAREHVLKILFMWEDQPAGASPEAAYAVYREAQALDADPFIDAVIDTVSRMAEPIDARIEAAANRWRIDRLSRVERALLRAATAELLSDIATPIDVLVYETVELAKRYGEAQAPAFVHGVIDQIIKRNTSGDLP